MSSAANRAWYRGLSFRLNAWYAGVLVTVFAAAAAGARLVASGLVETEQRALVRTELELHRSRIVGFGFDELHEFVRARRQQASVRWFVRITDASGKALFEAREETPEFRASDLAPSALPRTIVSQGRQAGQPWRLTSSAIEGKLWLQIGVDDRPRRAMLATVQRGFWALLAFGAVAGTLGGVFVTRRALSPLRALIRISRRIVQSGDLRTRVPLTGSKDELYELSLLVNQVLDKNQQLVDAMHQSLDNVAHDLRTPLSRLRSGAELALEREISPAALREALADCVEESERAIDMLHTLMDISEAEAGVMKLALEDVDLGALAREVIDLYEYVAEEAGVVLTCNIDGSQHVRGDRRRLAQAVANVVDNAIKYSDRGGAVTLRVQRAEAFARITVEDAGMGIEPGDLDKIWQRLYRTDKSRSRRGLGLGLSLVKAIVEAHGGSVHVTSQPARGSVFSLSLPLSHSEGPSPRAG